MSAGFAWQTGCERPLALVGRPAATPAVGFGRQTGCDPRRWLWSADRLRPPPLALVGRPAATPAVGFGRQIGFGRQAGRTSWLWSAEPENRRIPVIKALNQMPRPALSRPDGIPKDDVLR